MPCILKKPNQTSPGIITFTHNEYLFGGFQSPKLRTLLEKKGNWCFGVHIQGNCSFLPEWPDSPYIDFIMWPNKEEKYLTNVKSKIVPFSCVYFYPKPTLSHLKKFDLCIASRAVEHKNFSYSLTLVKEIIQKRPKTSIVFLVPDHRQPKIVNFSKKNDPYFDRALHFFNASEIRNISFISTSTSSFGLFPISSELYWTILELSRTSLLTSESEGTPRCVVESIIHQTMPITMKTLSSGLRDTLSSYPILELDKHRDAEKIINYLDHTPILFSEDQTNHFTFEHNWPTFLSMLNEKCGQQFENDWLTHDITNRLAGHIQKKNFQLMTPTLLKDWLTKTLSGHLEIEELY